MILIMWIRPIAGIATSVAVEENMIEDIGGIVMGRLTARKDVTAIAMIQRVSTIGMEDVGSEYDLSVCLNYLLAEC